MANKREFKKFATALGANVCEDIMINYYSIEGIDRKMAEESVGKVLAAVENATSRANVFFDKGARAFEDRKEYSRAKRAFFKDLFEKINKDFISEIDEALKMFNSSVPAEVKAHNKEIVNNA